MVWLHATPAYIPDGAWVLPATHFDGRSRTYPNGYGAHELRWYRPNRAYVFESGDVDPLQHLGRFTFTQPEYYLYEVEPEDLGSDDDVGALAMQSATCARALVVRCLHRPAMQATDGAGGHGTS